MQRRCLRVPSSRKLRSPCLLEPSKDSVEYVLQALWRSCRTNLHWMPTVPSSTTSFRSPQREKPHPIVGPCFLAATLQIQGQGPGVLLLRPCPLRMIDQSDIWEEFVGRRSSVRNRLNSAFDCAPTTALSSDGNCSSVTFP
jgi:hypothetical protein